MEEPKKLMRSNGMIAGVCGGLGEYFGVDPTVVRIIYLLLFFFAGTGLLLYLILWIVMPKKRIIDNNEL